MSALNPAKLAILAQQVVDAVQSIFEGYGAAVDQPTFYYRTGVSNPTAAPGAIAVSYGRVMHHTPGTADQITPVKTSFVVRSADFAIWVFRPLSDTLAGEAFALAESTFQPTLTDSDAVMLMTDAYIIPYGLVEAHAAGNLGNPGSPFGLHDTVPLAASGGIGGTRTDITLELS